MKQGDIVKDKEQPDSIMIVVDVLEQKANEKVITYDYNKNPKTVHSYNKQYPKDDKVVTVIYLENISEDIFELVNNKSLQNQVKNKYKNYYFPINRLKKLKNIKIYY